MSLHSRTRTGTHGLASLEAETRLLSLTFGTVKTGFMSGLTKKIDRQIWSIGYKPATGILRIIVTSFGATLVDHPGLWTCADMI